MVAGAEQVIDAGRGIRFKRNTSDVIPVIDFSPMLSSKPEERRKIAPEIRKACMEVGFFDLKNHGFPDAVTGAHIRRCGVILLCPEKKR